VGRMKEPGPAGCVGFGEAAVGQPVLFAGAVSATPSWGAFPYAQ